VTKLWNASRFALSHLEDWDGSPGEPTLVDRGLLAKLSAMEERATGRLLEYEFGGALREIEGFFWSTLCDNYLEMIKGRLYEPGTYGEAGRRGAQAALHRGLLDVLKMLAPFMPHVTEEIYQAGFKERVGEVSVHVALWPEGGDGADDEAEEAFDLAVDVVTAVRKYKSEHNLSMGAELKRLLVGADGRRKGLVESLLAELRSTSRASEIAVQSGGGDPSERSEEGVPLWIER
jgi:valyl-tRNA synthetase